MRGYAKGELFFELYKRPVFGVHVKQSNPDDMLLFDGSSLGFAMPTLSGTEYQYVSEYLFLNGVLIIIMFLCT